MSDAKNPDQNSPMDNGSAGNGSATNAETDVKELQAQLEKAKNDFLYLRAEFENYKKHAVKERSDIIKYGSERIARDLLTVLDNFERALGTQVTPENCMVFKQGVEMTASDLKALLSKHGIVEVKSEGVPFDPNVHEALSSEPTDSLPPGNIVRVFQKAYKIHDKLLRPAQVIVAKKPE